MNDTADKGASFSLFNRASGNGDAGESQLGYTFVLDSGHTNFGRFSSGEEITADGAAGKERCYYDYKKDIPQRILQMQRLYRYGNNSFRLKCANFYTQGKFMEDYEDNAPWDGKYLHYFPTYHDLNLRQLRGYFTWRTYLRRGEFRPIAASLAYIYLYELLCGIGTGSPEDALQKMNAFEKGFLDSGIGDPGMRKNLRRWKLDYCVLHNLPAETARSCADPSVLLKDKSLAVLRDPGEHSDEQVFNALCCYEGKRLPQSPVLKKDRTKGVHLFAAVWRHAAEHYGGHGTDSLFASMFGRPGVFEWHPLANTIHREDPAQNGTVYTLDASRSYRYYDGVWTEKRYEPLFFDRKKLRSFLRGTDCALRKILKTGHYLQEKEDEAWVKPFVTEAIAADEETEKRKRIERVSIDISQLEHIRLDADITRDSLLTEVEAEGAAEGPGREEKLKEAEAAGGEETGETAVNPCPDGTQPGNVITQQKEKSCENLRPESVTQAQSVELSSLFISVLRKLLRGESPDSVLKSAHVLPSVAADQINDALFDEIGDTVLFCEGDTIELVEDYREDVEKIILIQ